MTDPQTKTLLDQLAHLRRTDAFNVPALCKTGRELARQGLHKEARAAYLLCVEALRKFAQAGNVDLALFGESQVYRHFVLEQENETHYLKCFSDWRNEYAKLGRKLRDPAPFAEPAAPVIGFILLTGMVLAHTEVLFRLLGGRDRNGPQPRLYVLSCAADDFLARAAAAGVEVIQYEHATAEDEDCGKAVLWLRDRLRADRVPVAVWCSAPTWVSLVFAMRIAPVQVFWALRFHPIVAPFIDAYITYGAWDEQEKIIHKQRWTVCPMPLAVDDTLPDPAAVTALRSTLPQGFLLGTLARPEKIDSPPFLQAIAQILKANPQARYLWTGRTEHAGIARFFEAAGVSDRCHFVGWVDTRLYAAALDLFLESFPFGTGIVPYQALNAGTPLLSYFSELTIFGVNFPQALKTNESPDPERYPLLCARTPEDYVALATRLITEPEFRREVAARGQTFYKNQLADLPRYSARFFGALEQLIPGSHSRE